MKENEAAKVATKDSTEETVATTKEAKAAPKADKTKESKKEPAKAAKPAKKTKAPKEPKAPELIVSIAPHLKSQDSVAKIMWTVSACLIPPLILSAFMFGVKVLILAAVAIISCVVIEAATQKIMRRPLTYKDGSSVLTALLLIMIVPPDVSLAVPILGAFFAIFVGKEIMGGLGYNIFNPALLARAFLMATFPVAMTTAWIMPMPLEELGMVGQWIALLNGENLPLIMSGADAVTQATPLAVLHQQGLETFEQTFGSGLGLYGSFFIGWKPGSIGETSGLLLLIGGIFLIFKRYITWHVPVSMLGMIALLTWVFGGEALFSGDPLLAILSGGAMLGAFFMATDYVTSPSNPMAKIIFGMGIGAITVLIRIKGGYPEGVAYAILLMNPLSTVLDTWFRRKRFSEAAEVKA